jgi:hypothetical protein
MDTRHTFKHGAVSLLLLAALVALAAVLALTLSACGGTPGGTSGDSPDGSGGTGAQDTGTQGAATDQPTTTPSEDDPTNITGTTLEVDGISLLCPDGWSERTDFQKHNEMAIERTDASKPFARIIVRYYYDPLGQDELPDYYWDSLREDADVLEDLEDMELNGRVFKVFFSRDENFGTTGVELFSYTDDIGDSWIAVGLEEKDTFYDADIQAALASIHLTPS